MATILWNEYLNPCPLYKILNFCCVLIIEVCILCMHVFLTYITGTLCINPIT